ncbi:hypothetical protein EES41_37505 (plasmid) [Streptomyces sp. ADI95-16]|nr:hypothetical protein EES41_37505 [Streptomyces sp. ADI95-16]
MAAVLLVAAAAGPGAGDSGRQVDIYTQPPMLTMRSTPVRGTIPLTAMAQDLDRLLSAEHVRGPTYWWGTRSVGCSPCGTRRSNRHRSAGLVLVEALGPALKPAMATDWAAHVEALRHPGTPFAADPAFEQVGIDAGVTAIAGGGPLPPVPVAVLSKTAPFAAPPTIVQRPSRQAGDVLAEGPAGAGGPATAAPTPGDIEVYEARNAEDIATRINSGEKVSDVCTYRREGPRRMPEPFTFGQPRGRPRLNTHWFSLVQPEQ